MDGLYFDTFSTFTEDPLDSSESEDGVSNSCSNIPCKRCKEAAHLCKRCRRTLSLQSKSALELACETNRQAFSVPADLQLKLTAIEALPCQESSPEMIGEEYRTTFVSAENYPNCSLRRSSFRRGSFRRDSLTSSQALLFVARCQCWRCRRLDPARHWERCTCWDCKNMTTYSKEYWDDDTVTNRSLPNLPTPKYAQDILRRQWTPWTGVYLTPYERGTTWVLGIPVKQRNHSAMAKKFKSWYLSLAGMPGRVLHWWREEPEVD